MMMHRRLIAWLLAAAVLMPSLAFAQTGTVMPAPKFTALADDGTPCAGCLLTAYVAGTTTLQDTFNNVDLAPGHANTNPVVLDAAGRATVFLSAASYKFVLTNSTGGTTYWTQDNISANASFTVATDIAGTVGETVAAGQVVYMSDGSGSKTPGSWYLARGDLNYASSTALAIGIAPSAIASGASGAIRLAGRVTGLSGLVAGTAYYVSATPGALTSSAPTFSRTVGAADSTTSLVQSFLTSGFALLAASNTFTGTTNTFNNAIAVAGTSTFSGTSNSFTNTAGVAIKSLTMAGSTSGTLTVTPPAVATTSTLTLPGGPLTNFACGRLTLTTGVPVTTSDVTAATTLYYTPSGLCNLISLYDGSTTWIPRAFSEISIAVPATTSQMYDVWVYDSAGTATLEVLAWTNDTTRATALVLQNGVYVKTGATTRRYVGSFRTTTASGQTEDSLTKRYVWNYNNRVDRPVRRLETTATWSYATTTFRQANAAAGNQVEIVVGVLEDGLELSVQAYCVAAAVFSGSVGIGEDSTTTTVTGLLGTRGSAPSNGNAGVAISQWRGTPNGAGYHKYVWLEKGDGGTNTWQGVSAGDFQSGIHGMWRS